MQILSTLNIILTVSVTNKVYNYIPWTHFAQYVCRFVYIVNQSIKIYYWPSCCRSLALTKGSKNYRRVILVWSHQQKPRIIMHFKFTRASNNDNLMYLYSFIRGKVNNLVRSWILSTMCGFISWYYVSCTVVWRTRCWIEQFLSAMMNVWCAQ